MARKKIRLVDPEDMEILQEDTIGSQVSRLGHRRVKGLLKSIPNMPLDILHEIFSHLEPSDLLHLTRVAKAFRLFLLNKNALGIWISARHNVEDLPDCPPYLSEPAYAHLMFSPYCHNCLAANVQNIIFTFNARYCANCKKSLTVDSYMLGGKGGYAGGMTADMFCKTSCERRRIVYHKNEVESVWHSWLALPDNDEAREVFREEHRERVRQIESHSIPCEQWDRARKASRKLHLEELKKQKIDIVVDKLRSRGWNEELEAMRSSNYFELTDHVLIRQTKKMTDRAWKAIEPSIISLMRTYKKARLIKERRKELKTRLSWLTTMIKETGPELRVTRSDYQPHFVDFALMPEFRQLAEAPSSTHITREDFLELRDRLPFFENRWKDQIGYELASIISNRFRLQSHIEPLILAMTFFDCTSCGRRSMQFPSVIAHECLRSRYWRFREDSDAAYFYEDVALNAWNCRPWSSRHLSASRASERAMQIISACGLDPLKTTRMEIEALDPRLCCKTCSRPQALLIMSWRTAVEHARTAHGAIDQMEASWAMMCPRAAGIVQMCERAFRTDLFEEYYPKARFSCARCDDPSSHRNVTIARALDHVRRAHSIANPNPDGDIYVSGDTPPIIPKPVLLVSEELMPEDLTHKETKYYSDCGTFYNFKNIRVPDFD